MNIALNWSIRVLLLATVSLASGCGKGMPTTRSKIQPESVAAAATAQSPYKPVATFQEIMDSVVDMSSDYIWGAVSTAVDAKGLHEFQPRTDADWHNFRRRAVLLAEAANLIVVPSRRVANGDRTVEDKELLPVADIQKRLDTQYDQLVGFAGGMRDVSLKLIAAADRKDVSAVKVLGSTLDQVCEACHLVFWYPEQTQTAK